MSLFTRDLVIVILIMHHKERRGGLLEVGWLHTKEVRTKKGIYSLWVEELRLMVQP